VVEVDVDDRHSGPGSLDYEFLVLGKRLHRGDPAALEGEGAGRRGELHRPSTLVIALAR
jgi:hypothetical protein